MKKRIIAALTALVMVVTMVPVSAFADTYSVTDVEDLIGLAVKNNTTVAYTAKADLDKALAAYNSLSESDKNEVNDAKETALLDAVKAFEAYAAEVKNVNETIAKVNPGTVTSDMIGTPTTDIAKAKADFKVIAQNYKPNGGTVTVVLPADSKEKADVLKALVPKYDLLNTIAYLDANVVENIGKINTFDATVTDKNIADITANNYKSGTAGKAYITANSMKGEFYPVYIYLAKGYDKYMSTKELVDKYAGLEKKVGDLKLVFSKYTSVKSIDDATKADYDKLVKALSDAEAVIAANGEVIDPDFAGNSYKLFVDAYKVTKKAHDKFLTKADVEKAIRELPKVADIEKADYATLVKYCAQFNAIDVEVAAITDVKESIYDKVGDALAKRMATFDDAYIAEDYAKRFVAAMEGVSADVTRADVDAVNAAIKVIIDYKALGTTADAAGINVAKANMFDNTNVDELVKATELGASLNGGALDKAITALDKTAYTRLVLAQKTILAKARADQKAMEDVYAIIDGKFKAIKDEASAKAAQKVIDDYNVAYAKLAGFAKSDYDSKYGEIAKKAIDKAKAEIEKYIVDADVLIAKNDAVDAIKALLKIQRSNTSAGNAAYVDSVGYINAVEKILKDYPAVEALLVKENKVDFVDHKDEVAAKNLFEQYKVRKQFIADLTAESAAPTAVIKAIDALEIVKEDADKAKIDSVIASYDAAAKMYNALTPVEKAAVNNFAKFAKVSDALNVAVKNMLNAETAKIGLYDEKAPLTDAQRTVITNIYAMNDAYLKMVDVNGDDLFDSITDNITVNKNTVSLKSVNFAAHETYAKAYEKLMAEATDAAKAEFELIVPTLKAANVYYVNNDFVVNKNTAKTLIAAADAVANLSDEAKAYAEKQGGLELTYHYGQLLRAVKEAKALVLDYAKIDPIEDVIFDGVAATPEVVVRDANGIVIDSAEYTVAYSNNTVPGTAKVIVTAKADGKLIGTVEAEFKIIGVDAVNVTDVLVNDGKIRVKFDAVDVAGVKYEVAYKETNLGADAEYKTIVTENTNVLIDNLKKNTKYTVKVRAVVGDYAADWSELNWAIATKGGKYVLPKADAPTVLTNAGKLRVKSDIAGIDGDVKVQVYYKKTSEPSSAYKFVNGDDNILIEKLANNTQYTVKVRYYIKDVKGEKAFGSFSSIVHATTR